MSLNFTNIEALIQTRLNALTVNVTAASASGTQVTYTASNSFTAGQLVSITGLSTTAFNLQNVAIHSATSTQFVVNSTVTGTAVTGSTTGVAAAVLDTKELLLQMKAIETATTNLSLGKVVSEGLFQQSALTGIKNQIEQDIDALYDAIEGAANVTLTGAQTVTNKTLVSPILTGTPTAPTPTAGTNTTQVATTAFVLSEVASGITNLVGSSPTLLNTLQELASAINNDPAFFTTISNGLNTKAPIASPTFTGTVTFPANTSGANFVNIPNAALTNSSITIDGNAISLGGSGSALPSQTSNTGKFLTTNGSSATWGTPSYQTIQYESSGTVPARSTINFIGATASDDLINNRTTVTINPVSVSGISLIRQVEQIAGITIL
jgi:hypothetical protein